MLKVLSGRAICIRLIEFIIQIIRRTLLHYANLYLAGVINIISAYLVRAFFMYILDNLTSGHYALLHAFIMSIAAHTVYLLIGYNLQ